jgi:ketosteroid isomerase-like protein
MPETFEEAIDAFRTALDALLQGDAGPVKTLWSQRDDITVANPFGPPRRGPIDVGAAIDGAAVGYSGGSRWFEEVSRYATADLGYVVQLEHVDALVRGRETATAFVLRVTMVFRREGAEWKVAHRHADTVTTERGVDTLES